MKRRNRRILKRAILNMSFIMVFASITVAYKTVNGQTGPFGGKPDAGSKPSVADLFHPDSDGL